MRLFRSFLVLAAMFAMSALADLGPPPPMKSPTPEDWALADSSMAKRIQMRDDLRRIVKALRDLPGEPPHRGLRRSEAELATAEKEILQYADQLDQRFKLKINWPEKPDGRIGGQQPPPRPQAEMISRVFVTEKKAKSLAFLCDASGTMIQKFATLKEQLARTIKDLDPQQSFTLVFFQDEKPAAFNQGQLVLATEENKRKALQFLDDVTVTATTDPVPAIELAFAQKPEVMYLLTDGDFPDNDAVSQKIRKLDPMGKTRINTVAFVDPNRDTEKDFRVLLDKIARSTGGIFVDVDETKLDE